MMTAFGIQGSFLEPNDIGHVRNELLAENGKLKGQALVGAHLSDDDRVAGLRIIEAFCLRGLSERWYRRAVGKQWIRLERYQFCADDFWVEWREQGRRTSTNPKFLGNILPVAATRHWCRLIDLTVTSQLPSNHGRPVAVWQSCLSAHP